MPINKWKKYVFRENAKIKIMIKINNYNRSKAKIIITNLLTAKLSAVLQLNLSIIRFSYPQRSIRAKKYHQFRKINTKRIKTMKTTGKRIRIVCRIDKNRKIFILILKISIF